MTKVTQLREKKETPPAVTSEVQKIEINLHKPNFVPPESGDGHLSNHSEEQFPPEGRCDYYPGLSTVR